jgi:hypothetical protein
MDFHSGDMSPERILDQVRTRLAGLMQALSRIQAMLDPANAAPENHPLPPWYFCWNFHHVIPSLTISRKEIEAVHPAVTSHLTVLYDILSDPAKSQFLKQAHVYPTPQYPREAEHILESLLRKRLQPPVQDWLEHSLTLGRNLESSSQPVAHLEELWEWAGPASSSIAAEIFPELAGEEESAAQRKGKEAISPDNAQPMMPLESVLKFTTSP